MDQWQQFELDSLGDDFILNPSYREIEKGDLDIVVAGSPDGIVMIEAGANQLI